MRLEKTEGVWVENSTSVIHLPACCKFAIADLICADDSRPKVEQNLLGMGHPLALPMGGATCLW